ncbi:DNA-binding transcriptional regulator, LysR family [Vibrio xiamenensis]|uniref:DNA-binding transcriptional regulator, LysR family n=1 Tax=Vibrio xiamenensis TaxID=861298 RepID=A0A1G8ABW2_9VIBR|nr:LysR substrate-binding domain-containing protein [Vibrio xiamenensis]SDH18515.1 DNA-binding transcriptional regulator, LysR family [Vibrio xiamenensis]
MKKLAPLKSLYSFVAVAETGSMTEAANQLNVSHSAVSQAIKSLENQLGQTLFHRVGRRVELNVNGRKYYKEIAPSLEKIVDATQKMMQKEQSNRITLNMINSLAMHWWIPQMNRFGLYAPNLDVRISNLVGAFSLPQEGVDVAVIHGAKADWQDYYCERLAHDQLIMVCSPELVEPQDTPESLLARYPAIMATNERRKDDWKIWAEFHHIAIPPASNNLNFSSSLQAMQAAIRQLGVFVTHRLFIKEDIKQGLLIEVGHPVENPAQSFYFACHKDKLKNEYILQLRQWIRSEFANI